MALPEIWLRLSGVWGVAVRGLDVVLSDGWWPPYVVRSPVEIPECLQPGLDDELPLGFVDGIHALDADDVVVLVAGDADVDSEAVLTVEHRRRERFPIDSGQHIAEEAPAALAAGLRVFLAAGEYRKSTRLSVLLGCPRRSATGLRQRGRRRGMDELGAVGAVGDRPMAVVRGPLTVAHTRIRPLPGH
jgi:hypothetical protein